MPALAVQDGAVPVLEFDKMVVEDLAIVFSFPHFASSHSLGLYGVTVHGPVDDVQVVDMLFRDMVAAEPDKIVPVAHLVFHFRLSGLSWVHPYAVVIPPGLRPDDLPDGAIMYPFDQFPVRVLVAALQADDYVQFFLFGYLCSGQYALYTGRIGGDGFFHEDLLALVDRLFEMDGAESRRCREDHHIGLGHGFLIRVEAGEFIFFFHLEPAFFIFQRIQDILVAAVEAVPEGIRHGYELHVLAGAQGLDSGARPTAATSDEGNLNDGICA